MEINLQNIKEISLVTNYVFMRYDENAYTDLLRISKNWISYKRINFHTKKETTSWSYKTFSIWYKRYFESLIEKVNRVFHESDNIFSFTNCGSFNLRVTFNDDSYVDLHRDGNFEMQGLDYLARAIKDLIPKKELHPDFLDKEFTREKLTKDTLTNIDKNNIVALMYAEGGAGNPGEIEIVDEDNVVYSNDSHYSGIEIPKEQIVSQFEVTDLFDVFNHKDGYASGNINVVILNETTWIYLNLGNGNHLYLRKDFYFRYGNEIFDVSEHERYGNWRRLTGHGKLEKQTKEKYRELTCFISQLENDKFGELIVDNENDGSPKHPFHFPFVNYSKVVNYLEKAVYKYCEKHPEYEHYNYSNTLKSKGIDGSLSGVDVSSFDDKTVIAMLVAAIRAERFCDGALLSYLKDGSIIKWLKRLEELDEKHA